MSFHFNITIVGLGLMGASLAKALSGFKNCNIYGIDANASVIKKAEADGVITKGDVKNNGFLEKSDLVICCLYPNLCIDFINNSTFKPGAVVSDICGVKEYVLKNIKNDSIDFLGGHPMAGREVSGYGASTGDLFKDAYYILTPTEKTSDKAVSLMREVINYIGCKKAIVTTAKKHDAMIAYTSQLMHVVAVALCDNPLFTDAACFSAGSLADCTRVANLNASMWAELFYENRHELCKRISEFENSLATIKNFLINEDTDGLCEFLENAASIKRRFL